MSLLMSFPTRRGRKAEGLSTPTTRRPAMSWAFCRTRAGDPNPDQFSPAGVDQPYGSVSTARTSTDPASMCPAGIVGMLRFRPSVQRRSGVDVSTMDTGTPQSLGQWEPGTRPPTERSTLR